MTHKYIGTKIVLAWAAAGKDGAPGYGVKYEDGYTSWSPKAQFEAAYRDIEGPVQALTFGDALHMLKLGKRVARAGWNGKDMWISLSGVANVATPVDAGSFWSENNADYAYNQKDHVAYVLPCITMKTADGSILMGWPASQTDMLAEDWVVLA